MPAPPDRLNGQVTDLALNGSSVASQTLIGRDWRYYRFTVPADAPINWNLTFGQQVGDVVMWLRDCLPPGSAAKRQLKPPVRKPWKAWYSDSKNQGPYS